MFSFISGELAAVFRQVWTTTATLPWWQVVVVGSFSGKVGPPPATLTMVAGGGGPDFGRVFGIVRDEIRNARSSTKRSPRCGGSRTSNDMSSLFSDVGCAGRKSGPEQTRVAVPEHPTVCRLEFRFRNYVCFRTTAQKSVIPLFVSCFAGFISPWYFRTELAEERTEDHGTTFSQPRRSDRGGFTLRYIMIICRVLMLLSIHVETELAEERTEDHGTTFSQPRRSDRGGFTLRYIMMCLHDYDLCAYVLIGSPRTDCIRCTQCECGLVWHGLSLAYDAGLQLVRGSQDSAGLCDLSKDRAPDSMRTLRSDWWSVPRFQLRALRRSTFVELFRQRRARRPERGRVRVSRGIFVLVGDFDLFDC
ncbi:hypothetical protein LXL04_015782 [Taraxacum kok-saghyz]